MYVTNLSQLLDDLLHITMVQERNFQIKKHLKAHLYYMLTE
jgi:hypothetical protein